MKADPHEPLAQALADPQQQVEQCRDAPAEQAQQGFRKALLQVIAVRNARLSNADDTLRQLNVLLSVMTNIQFPLAGFHRGRIDEVLDLMQALRRG